MRARALYTDRDGQYQYSSWLSGRYLRSISDLTADSELSRKFKLPRGPISVAPLTHVSRHALSQHDRTSAALRGAFRPSPMRHPPPFPFHSPFLAPFHPNPHLSFSLVHLASQTQDVNISSWLSLSPTEDPLLRRLHKLCWLRSTGVGDAGRPVEPSHSSRDGSCQISRSQQCANTQITMARISTLAMPTPMAVPRALGKSGGFAAKLVWAAAGRGRTRASRRRRRRRRKWDIWCALSRILVRHWW
ncbi:hypothetical protein F4778DRAFT_461446 [Xylariomycetidae sp. FL2044]|nr:hypothetical protein F4778DRAFT_461446 [Xylariomycetidae sp. FL2044]